MLKQANLKIAALKSQLCSLQEKQRSHGHRQVNYNSFKKPAGGRK
jgi:hypothetical protein